MISIRKGVSEIAGHIIPVKDICCIGPIKYVYFGGMLIHVTYDIWLSNGDRISIKNDSKEDAETERSEFVNEYIKKLNYEI